MKLREIWAIRIRLQLPKALRDLALAIALAWWLTLAPSHDLDWQPDVARLPTATVNGPLLTLNNARNFSYRDDRDVTERWRRATALVQRPDTELHDDGLAPHEGRGLESDARLAAARQRLSPRPRLRARDGQHQQRARLGGCQVYYSARRAEPPRPCQFDPLRTFQCTG